ncbi:hypothetical protein [Actinoplanes sp. NPDC026623]|uniref:hypothetical protein n=1 Tax=Actinoplanes sp. NPDC026623 TaxID=3155610 RepID=UPI0033F4D955
MARKDRRNDASASRGPRDVDVALLHRREHTLVINQTIVSRITRWERLWRRFARVRATLGVLQITILLTGGVTTATAVALAAYFVHEDRPAAVAPETTPEQPPRATPEQPPGKRPAAEKPHPADRSPDTPSPEPSSDPGRSPNAPRTQAPPMAPHATVTPPSSRHSSALSIEVPVHVSVDPGDRVVIVYRNIKVGLGDLGVRPCVAKGRDLYACTLRTADLTYGDEYRVTTHAIAEDSLAGLLSNTTGGLLGLPKAITSEIVVGPPHEDQND